MGPRCQRRKYRITFIQCDQIGLHLKGLGDKISSKVAQLFGNVFGNFEKHDFYSNSFFAYFLGNLRKNLATFYSSICPHCFYPENASLLLHRTLYAAVLDAHRGEELASTEDTHRGQPRPLLK